MISSTQRPLRDNAQHWQETDIHAPGTGTGNSKNLPDQILKATQYIEKGMLSNTTMSVKVYVMAILDNYMQYSEENSYTQ